jgi:hypothetical protein
MNTPAATTDPIHDLPRRVRRQQPKWKKSVPAAMGRTEAECTIPEPREGDFNTAGQLKKRYLVRAALIHGLPFRQIVEAHNVPPQTVARIAATLSQLAPSASQPGA